MRKKNGILFGSSLRKKKIILSLTRVCTFIMVLFSFGLSDI